MNNYIPWFLRRDGPWLHPVAPAAEPWLLTVPHCWHPAPALASEVRSSLASVAPWDCWDPGSDETSRPAGSYIASTDLRVLPTSTPPETSRVQQRRLYGGTYDRQKLKPVLQFTKLRLVTLTHLILQFLDTWCILHIITERYKYFIEKKSWRYLNGKAEKYSSRCVPLVRWKPHSQVSVHSLIYWQFILICSAHFPAEKPIPRQEV